MTHPGKELARSIHEGGCLEGRGRYRGAISHGDGVTGLEVMPGGLCWASDLEGYGESLAVRPARSAKPA
jgi:hypothetical protein